MSGFLGLGGAQAQDSKTAQQGLGSLNNVFNFGMNRANSLSSTGDTTTGTGTSTALSALPTIQSGASSIQNSANYFKNLVSGNRTAAAQAAAPQTNAALQQNDAARRQQGSMGTARGGGVASTNQTQQDATTAQINNQIFGARTQAAGEQVGAGSALASTGTQAGNIGLGVGQLGTEQTGQGLTAGSLAGNAVNAETQDALAAQKQSYEIARTQTGDVAGVLGSIFGAIPGFGKAASIAGSF